MLNYDTRYNQVFSNSFLLTESAFYTTDISTVQRLSQFRTNICYIRYRIRPGVLTAPKFSPLYRIKTKFGSKIYVIYGTGSDSVSCLRQYFRRIRMFTYGYFDHKYHAVKTFLSKK